MTQCQQLQLLTCHFLIAHWSQSHISQFCLVFIGRQLATDLRLEADLLLRRQRPSDAQLRESTTGAAGKPETQEVHMGNSTTGTTATSVAATKAQTQEVELGSPMAAAAREPETQELSLHLLPGPIEVHPVQYAVLPG